MVRDSIKITPLSEVRSIEHLCPVPIHYERTALMEHIRSYNREALRSYYLRQPVEGAEVWANYVVNLWEYERGVAEVTSYPWKVAIPMTDVCNARCTFCTAPLVPDPQCLKVEEVKYFADALRYAIHVDLQGLGEPLAHPQFEEIVEEIGKYISSVAQLGIITNGWLLCGRRWELLKKIHITNIHVSVNAATDKTHQVAMGSRPGTFDKVVKNIEDALADTGWPRFLKTSLVVTRHSLPEVSDFIEMFVNRGVKIFQINALLPLEHPDWGFGHTDQYLDLWPGRVPNARELVIKAQKTIDHYRGKGILFFTSPEHWLDRLDQWRNPKLVQLQAGPMQDDSLQIVQSSAAPNFVSDPDVASGSVSQTSTAGDNAGISGDSSKLSKAPPQGWRGLFGRLFSRSHSHALEEAPAGAIAPATTAPRRGSSLPTSSTRDPHLGSPKKSGRIFCPMVYDTLSVFQHNLNVSTCCYMQSPPGFQPPNLRSGDLLKVMNDPGLKLVRRTLHRDHLRICSACGYGNFRS